MVRSLKVAVVSALQCFVESFCMICETEILRKKLMSTVAESNIRRKL